MLISPKKAIENGWIVFPSWMTDEQKEKCIQPNAIDITADKLFEVVPNHGAYLSEDGKQFHTLKEVPVDADGFWIIAPHTVYDVTSDFYVTVPEKVAGELIIRSTLNRCGIALNAGLYDSGFKGNIGMGLFNRINGSFKLKPHTRVCQIKLIVSDSAGTYAGGYNGGKGTHWTSTKGAQPNIYDAGITAKIK